ncbi:MAG TPA: winged helix-turn-helix transcriptional regulator [Kaistia sp.]|jgi:DNA-binding MarR family transcriptional regulator|nr:winged helix-turn-helix transcriptional regulator [Kaistia sp.]
MKDERDVQLMLGILDAVERNSLATQRSIARELGVALGLVNAYLRRCIKKGFVKASSIPFNRYTYYVTPAGFTEKGRLTAEFLAYSFRFFRDAREQSAGLLLGCREAGWRRIVLLGCGDLAEIALIGAAEAGVEIVAVVDASAVGQTCGGRPVVAEAPAFDALMVTDTNRPIDAVRTGWELVYNAGLSERRLLVPQLLGVSPSVAARSNA